MTNVSEPRGFPRARWSVAFLAILSSALYVVFVRFARGQAVDNLSYAGSRIGRDIVQHPVQAFLDTLPVASVALSGVLCLYFAATSSRWLPLLVAVICAVGANATTQLLKHVLLHRPDHGYHGVYDYMGNTFPSGHSTVAATAGLALFLVAPTKLRKVAAMGGMLFALAGGVGTIVNGYHRPSDVCAAYLVVALWGVLGMMLLARFNLQEYRDEPAAGPWDGAFLALGLAGSLVTAGVFIFVVAKTAEVNVGAELFFAYLGGVAATVAVIFLLGFFAFALRRIWAADVSKGLEPAGGPLGGGSPEQAEAASPALLRPGRPSSFSGSS